MGVSLAGDSNRRSCTTPPSRSTTCTCRSRSPSGFSKATRSQPRAASSIDPSSCTPPGTSSTAPESARAGWSSARTAIDQTPCMRGATENPEAPSGEGVARTTRPLARSVSWISRAITGRPLASTSAPRSSAVGRARSASRTVVSSPSGCSRRRATRHGPSKTRTRCGASTRRGEPESSVRVGGADQRPPAPLRDGLDGEPGHAAPPSSTTRPRSSSLGSSTTSTRSVVSTRRGRSSSKDPASPPSTVSQTAPGRSPVSS